MGDNPPVKIWWGREWWTNEKIQLIEPAPTPEVMAAQLTATPPKFFTEVFDAPDDATAEIIGKQKLKIEFDRWQNKKTSSTPSA